MDSPPLSAARALRAAGHDVSLLLSAQTGPYGRRSLVAIDPDDTIVSPPGAGAGLPAIPPRLVHAAHGRGVWIGAVAYDAGLDLHGIASRHASPDAALVAGYHAAYAAYDHDAGAWTVHGEGPTAGGAGGRRRRRARGGARRRAAAGGAHRAQHGHARRSTRRPAARCSG